MGCIVSRMSILTIRNWGTARCMTNFGYDVFVFPIENMKQSFDNRRVSEFLKYVKKIKPNIFFISKEDHLPARFFYEYRRSCPNSKVVMLYWDQRGTIPRQVCSRRGVIDSIIINNQDQKQFSMYKKFGVKGVYTLYDSANSKVFYPINMKRKYDLFFGGSNYPRRFPLSGIRYNLICGLKKKFLMDVRGSGWPFYTNRVVRKELYSRALQSAKINIGINHFNVTRYYEERLVECMASGRMHMTLYIPGMERDFVNHKHLVWFKSADECVQLVRFYLDNDVKRERIAACGREKALSMFGVDKTMRRLSYIFKCVGGISKPEDVVRY